MRHAMVTTVCLVRPDELAAPRVSGRQGLARRRFARCVAALLVAALARTNGLTAAEPAVLPPAAARSDEQAALADQALSVIAARCHDCHGPDAQEGGLRLTSRENLLAGGDSGQGTIEPGSSATSRMMRLVRGEQPDLRMPPADAAQPLSPDEIDLLARWIDAGAPWPVQAAPTNSASQHWAFQVPVSGPPPAVQNSGWARGAIDHFVLAPLEADGLAPQPEADPNTLARRVALDLIGLPLAPDEVDSFVSDASPDAFDRLVDRLLADPGYGERWARVWLDLARYADSKGYGSDPLRSIWRYRDWVIEAFNSNLPFDQFTTEQLAGDLLPEATTDQQLATAFHRNTMTNDEGGTDDEEFRIAAIKDRVDTTFQVWMGLTMGCAKCHSHKFDPITQREYYAAAALFNQTADADRNDESPRLATPTDQQVAELADLDRQSAAALAALESAIAEARADEAAWQAQARWALEALDWPGLARRWLALLRLPADQRSMEDQAELRGAYRELAPRWSTERRALADLRRRRSELSAAIPTTPVLQELPPESRRETHLLIKGNYLNPGPLVEAGVPAAFQIDSMEPPRDRLGLARWLVHPANPLTARVAVNRVWAQLFGRGLVESEEDFGTQGQPPTHPALLDWLACDFATDWDWKRLLKQIVTSSTYRQSSVVSAEVRQRDPANRRLARGPSGRLEAEMVRDQALMLAGLLSRKLGGPSVFPPQPDGLWRAAFNGERTWATSTGEDRYRRAIYTFWRRTVPYPSMATFDAPSREVCTVRRISTNTPLQAFVTLNDPVYVEAAQALARRLMAYPRPEPDAIARHGLRLCLGRPASEAEVAELVSLYHDAEAHYAGREPEAVAMATVPLGPLPPGQPAQQAAAWTVVANVLLNLDGVLSKR